MFQGCSQGAGQPSHQLKRSQVASPLPRSRHNKRWEGNYSPESAINNRSPGVVTRGERASAPVHVLLYVSFHSKQQRWVPATGRPRASHGSGDRHPLRKTALTLSAQTRHPTSTPGFSADSQYFSSNRVRSDASHGLGHLPQEGIAGQTDTSRPPSRCHVEPSGAFQIQDNN